MTLETEFLTTAADKLAENLGRIETCLTELPAPALWARHSENENAVGNLVLHLDGNVHQWLLSGIGSAPDARDRPAEFAARAGADAAELSAKLRGTVSRAIDLIRALPSGRLGEEVAIQGHETTVLSAIFHVVEHFSGHTYQIILLTKQFTGKDLGFYSYLDKTGRRESGHVARELP
jgi:uncharacterized damage-inducible protein DinB